MILLLLSNIGIVKRHTNGSSLFRTDRNKSPGTKNTLRMRLTMPREQWIPRPPIPAFLGSPGKDVHNTLSNVSVLFNGTCLF